MRTTLLALLLCACGTGLNPVATGPTMAYEPAAGPQVGEAQLTNPCDFVRAAEPKGILAGATSAEAFLMLQNGQRLTLVSGGTSTWVSEPVVRGDFLMVASTALRDGVYHSSLKLFDAGGAQLATLEGSGTGYLSDRGVMAARSEQGGMDLMWANGKREHVRGLTPVGEVGPNGRLPVMTAEHATSLFELETGELEALPVPTSGWSEPQWSGDTLVYLGQLDKTLVLVRLKNGEVRTTPIVAANQNVGISIEQVSGGTAVLVTGSWVQVRSRLDLETGELTALQVEVPAGSQFAGRHSASLADDGSLIAAFTAEGSTGLFRSLDGHVWQALGDRITGAGVVQFAGRRGSWLMSAGSGFGAEQGTLGVISSMGRSQRLPAFAPGLLPDASALSSDGRCAAVWSKTAGGFALSVTDLALGTRHTVTEVKTTERPIAALWLR